MTGANAAHAADGDAAATEAATGEGRQRGTQGPTPAGWCSPRSGVLGCAAGRSMIAAAIAAAFYGKQTATTNSSPTVVPPEELLAQRCPGAERVSMTATGTLLYEFFDDVRRVATAGAACPTSPPALIDATVATEDSELLGEQRPEHARPRARRRGRTSQPVRRRRLLRGLRRLLHHPAAGEERIHPEAKNAPTERSVERKLKEAAIALELTNQLLEGAGPRVVPQLDLLRRHLHRDRGGRRRATSASRRSRADPGRVGVAGRHPAVGRGTTSPLQQRAGRRLRPPAARCST